MSTPRSPPPPRTLPRKLHEDKSTVPCPTPRAAQPTGSRHRRSRPSNSNRNREQPAARKRARTAGSSSRGISQAGSASPKSFRDDVETWGVGEREEEEVEWYEDHEGHMDGLGWNEFWRRGDKAARATGRGGQEWGSSEGHGLDESSMALARRV